MTQTRRIFSILFRVVIAAVLLIYLWHSGAIDWSDLIGLIEAWPLAGAATILLLTAAAVGSSRLCVLLKPQGLHLSFMDSFRLLLVGQFFNTFLPSSTGGDVVKIYYASAGNRGRRTEVTTIILLDRAFGMFTMVLWPLLAAPFFATIISDSQTLQSLLWADALVVVILVTVMLLGMTSRVRDSRVMAWAFKRLPLGGYLQRIFDTIHTYRHHKFAMMAALGISIAAQGLSLVAMLLIAQATNADGYAWRMLVVIPLGLVANTIPLTPGGLGVGEAAFEKLFLLTGLTGGAVVILGWRLLMTLISLLGLAVYLKGRQQFVHDASTA